MRLNALCYQRAGRLARSVVSMWCLVYFKVIIPRVQQSLSIKCHLNTANWVPRYSPQLTLRVLIQTLLCPLNQTALPNKETKITVCFVCKLTWWILGWRYSHAPLNEFSFQVNEAELWTYGSNTHVSPRFYSSHFISFSVIEADIWVKFQSLEVQHTIWLLSNFMLSV